MVFLAINSVTSRWDWLVYLTRVYGISLGNTSWSIFFMWVLMTLTTVHQPVHRFCWCIRKHPFRSRQSSKHWQCINRHHATLIEHDSTRPIMRKTFIWIVVIVSSLELRYYITVYSFFCFLTGLLLLIFRDFLWVYVVQSHLRSEEDDVCLNLNALTRPRTNQVIVMNVFIE